MGGPEDIICSPPRPPKLASAAEIGRVFPPNQTSVETTEEHPLEDSSEDKDEEGDTQGVSSALEFSSPRLTNYRRSYDEAGGVAAAQEQAKQYLRQASFGATGNVTDDQSSDKDDDGNMSVDSVPTADARPRVFTRPRTIPSRPASVSDSRSILSLQSLSLTSTPSRSCPPSFSKSPDDSPPAKQDVLCYGDDDGDYDDDETFIRRRDEVWPEIVARTTRSCAKSPTKRKEHNIYLPFNQPPESGDSVAYFLISEMIEVNRQVNEGLGSYPVRWRSMQLGLHDKKSKEFAIALATDKIALDAYKLGHKDGSEKSHNHPALTDGKLADAYGVDRNHIRQCLFTIWLPEDHQKAKKKKRRKSM